MATPWLVNPPKKRRKRSQPAALKRYWAKRKKNPSHLMVVNQKKKGKKMAKRKRRQPAALKRYQASRKRRPAARTYRRRRSNPAPKRRQRSYRRNPIFRGKAIEQMLLVGAGFLLTPMAANLIPFTPTTAIGEYIKKAAAVTVGGTIVTQVFGKRYGNALLLGGMISVGVDILRDFVPAFGGMGAYFPPNAEIEAMSSMGNGMAAPGVLPEAAGVPSRWGSRYASSAGAIC